jgi:hypothetical protein
MKHPRFLLTAIFIISLNTLSATSRADVVVATGPEDDDISELECKKILMPFLVNLIVDAGCPQEPLSQQTIRNMEYFLVLFIESPQMRIACLNYNQMIVLYAIIYILHYNITDVCHPIYIIKDVVHEAMIEACMTEWLSTNQTLPHFSMHDYTAPWVIKKNTGLIYRKELYMLTFRKFCKYIGIDPGLPADNHSITLLKNIIDGLQVNYLCIKNRLTAPQESISS